MAIPYNTDATVTAQVAAQLQVTVAALTGPGNWPTFITRGNLSGNNDIVQLLLGKSFTFAQLDTSDQVQSWTLDQAVFWSLTYGGVAGQIPEYILKSLDRREEVKNCGFLTQSGGQVILYPMPNGSPIGGIASGENEIHRRLVREYDQGLGRNWGSRGFYGGGGGY